MSQSEIKSGLDTLQYNRIFISNLEIPMAKTNVRAKKPPVLTHEGGKAYKTTPELELTKAVLSCMLFEDQYYRSGSEMADRMLELCDQVSPQFVADLALKARNDIYLRSVPLFLMVKALKMQSDGNKVGLGELISEVIQRPDEMGEIISLYWKYNTTKMLPNQLKVGIRKALKKFKAYQLAKHDYNSAAVSVKDVLRLVHPKPDNKQQSELWKSIIDGTIQTPDTWETALSSGADKKETFERLIREKKLGYMALLRNLRNMEQVGCDLDLVTEAITNQDAILKSKLMPFRFLSAFHNVINPALVTAIDKAFVMSMANVPVLKGTTILLVDVSGSMNHPVSFKSSITLMTAASAVAAILKETGRCVTYTFSEGLVKVSSMLHGLEYIYAVRDSQANGGTYLSDAVSKVEGDPCDRVIIITDEQSHDGPPAKCWAKYGYVVNVAGYAPSVVNGARGWQSIAGGWSDKIVSYIAAYERFMETGSLDKVEDEESND